MTRDEHAARKAAELDAARKERDEARAAWVETLISLGEIAALLAMPTDVDRADVVAAVTALRAERDALAERVRVVEGERDRATWQADDANDAAEVERLKRERDEAHDVLNGAGMGSGTVAERIHALRAAFREDVTRFLAARDAARRERDEARAEVERLRGELEGARADVGGPVVTFRELDDALAGKVRPNTDGSLDNGGHARLVEVSALRTERDAFAERVRVVEGERDAANKAVDVANASRNEAFAEVERLRARTAALVEAATAYRDARHEWNTRKGPTVDDENGRYRRMENARGTLFAALAAMKQGQE